MYPISNHVFGSLSSDDVILFLFYLHSTLKQFSPLEEQFEEKRSTPGDNLKQPVLFDWHLCVWFYVCTSWCSCVCMSKQLNCQPLVPQPLVRLSEMEMTGSHVSCFLYLLLRCQTWTEVRNPPLPPTHRLLRVFSASPCLSYPLGTAVLAHRLFRPVF